MMIEREAIDYLRNDDLAKGVGMVVDIPFPLVVGAPSILIWMGRVFRGTYGRPFECLSDTNKEKTNFNHIP